VLLVLYGTLGLMAGITGVACIGIGILKHKDQVRNWGICIFALAFLFVALAYVEVGRSWGGTDYTSASGA